MSDDAPETIPDLPDIDPADFPAEDDGPLMPHASATYSPEDNKLRIYPAGTRVDSVLDDAEYAQFKAAGYKWAAKQECFVCPRWTPQAEDWAIRLCGEIEDEDKSPEERSADRAERFSGYLDKRATEAGLTADYFEAGPGVYGHQSRARAERQALRHDRYRVRAVSQWSKAEYWQRRTEGVISHALHRSSAPVRRSRIKGLEAEQRKHEASRQEYAKRFAAWSKVPTLDGADYQHDDTDASLWPTAYKLAYTLANSSLCWSDYTHPRTGRKASLWSLLTDRDDPITAAEAAALWLDGKPTPDAPDSWAARWSAHYELRLTYERAMLAAEGGTAADVDMEPGGWLGSRQIQAVNRSPVTGKVVSVKLWGTTTGYTKESNYTKQETRPCLVTRNIERLGEDVYRPPTDEERAAFLAEKKAKKAPPIPLINPTPAEAQRLQDWLNQRAADRAKESNQAPPNPAKIEETTQLHFSRNSGDGCIFYVGQFTINGTTIKVRMRSRVFEYRAADSVLILTDKPQKSLPAWDKPTPAPKAEQQTKAAPVAVSDRQPAAGKLLTIEELEAAIS